MNWDAIKLRVELHKCHIMEQQDIHELYQDGAVEFADWVLDVIKELQCAEEKAQADAEAALPMAPDEILCVDCD